MLTGGLNLQKIEGREMTVKKAKKKPDVIEFMQFDGIHYKDIEKWIGVELKQKVFSFGDCYSVKLSICIPTLDGGVWASPGDYIVKDAHGKFYPYEQDFFERNYEEI